MKQMHRSDLFCWSEFNEDRNIDFHSFVWVRDEGNVIIDPLSISEHDLEHLKSLGKIAWIALTNSSHARGIKELLEHIEAPIAIPQAEAKNFPVAFDKTLAEGDELVPGFDIIEMQGSKTPGELCFLIEKTTLITGDLVRSHKGGVLHLLPPEKLVNVPDVIASIKKLQAIESIETVLPGDGFHFFENGLEHLKKISLDIKASENCNSASLANGSVC